MINHGILTLLICFFLYKNRTIIGFRIIFLTILIFNEIYSKIITVTYFLHVSVLTLKSEGKAVLNVTLLLIGTDC